jgi:hypothetical protein
LDCYLTLQQLEFRLHSLFIIPTKLHIKAIVIGTLWSCIRLTITLDTTTHFVSL